MEPLSRRNAIRAGVLGTAAVAAVATPASTAAASPAGGGVDAAAATAEGWLSVTDYGAVGDGATNDTAAIQAALNAARATSPCAGLYFPAGRTYRVSDQVVAAGLTDFVISGHGATIALMAGAAASVKGAKAVLRISGCRRFKVLGLTVRDTDRAQQYDGIAIGSSSAGVVDGVVVENVRFNGIAVFDAVPGRSDDITITNCTTEGTRFGISSNGKDVRISNNHVAMDWPSTEEARVKGGVWSEPSDYYDGIGVWAGADRTVISGNTITECGQTGVYTQACTNLVVADNTIIGGQLRGIEVDGRVKPDGSLGGTAAGVSITGNVVTGCDGNINILSARDITIVGNRSENPRADLESACIALNQGANKAVVVGNHARQAHPTWPAIYVHEASTDVTLAWNAIDAGTPYQAPADTVVMQRTGADQIRVSGQITTDAKVIAGGGIGVGNSATATTVGAVVRKFEVFSSTGVSLGWVPIYKTIT